MLHLFTCNGRIMPRLAELLLVSVRPNIQGLGAILDIIMRYFEVYSI